MNPNKAIIIYRSQTQANQDMFVQIEIVVRLHINEEPL